MSLLTVIQNVANDLSLPAPTTVIGNQDITVSTMLAQAQQAGRSLSARPQNGWVSQITEYTFNTVAIGPLNGDVVTGSPLITGLSSTTGIVAGQYVNGTGFISNTQVLTVDSPTQVTVNSNASPDSTGNYPYTFGQCDYPLPADYGKMVDNTLWDRTRFWQMRGAMSPQAWQLYKSSPVGQASIQRRWRIRLATGATAGSTPVFSIDPIVTDNGSILVFEYVSTGWCKSNTGVAQSQWQADTDVGILDETLMYLGTRWRTLNRLGLAYAEEQDEYENQADLAYARDGGSATLDMAPLGARYLLGPWSVQEGFFPGT